MAETKAKESEIDSNTFETKNKGNSAVKILSKVEKRRAFIKAVIRKKNLRKKEALVSVDAGTYLGGKKNLTLKALPETEEDYIQLIRKGISKKSIDHLIETTSIPAVVMAELLETTPRKLAAIKPNTLMEKSQSEKAVSIARLYALGEEVLESKDEFQKWMNGRVPSLGNKRPKEFLDTTSGIQMLMDELNRIQHGVYS
ncbi:MAG: DUF2384 domain-containing protein [Chitinophagaceae bacterium]|nr:DUF2384 domain-containing protein [Chitinophagaceae bacterium]